MYTERELDQTKPGKVKSQITLAWDSTDRETGMTVSDTF